MLGPYAFCRERIRHDLCSQKPVAWAGIQILWPGKVRELLILPCIPSTNYRACHVSNVEESLCSRAHLDRSHQSPQKEHWVVTERWGPEGTAYSSDRMKVFPSGETV